MNWERDNLQKIMSVIVGKRLFDMFEALDLFVINFGDELEYSLHVSCFVRVRSSDRLLMTSQDEFYYPNHEPMSDEDYEIDELHENSLLNETLKLVKEKLKDAVVSDVQVSELADIKIFFSNGIVLESFADCLMRRSEYFRFFRYNDDETEPYYVVRYDGNSVVLEEH